VLAPQALERYGYEALQARDGEAAQDLMRTDGTGRRILVAVLAPLLLSVTGAASECNFATDSGSGTFEFRISGTVRYLESDGCWQLQSDDGRRYELLPGQAPASLLRDGAKVLVTAETTGDPGTGCDVGQPLRVRRVMSVQAQR
jgi:hypothetical protein